MSREGVAIKVKIGLKPNGRGGMWHDYPDWDKLPLTATETHQSHQIVKWRYDCCGHTEDTVDSPVGQQWGMMIVTEQFANEALAMYPDKVSIMTEVQAKAFWNNKANKKMPKDKVNSKSLTDFNTELTLRKSLGQNTTALEARITKALDRNDDTEEGVHKNKQKDFDDAKTHLGFTIKKP
jgi:hypothetical protein